MSFPEFDNVSAKERDRGHQLSVFIRSSDHTLAESVLAPMREIRDQLEGMKSMSGIEVDPSIVVDVSLGLAQGMQSTTLILAPFVEEETYGKKNKMKVAVAFSFSLGDKECTILQGRFEDKEDKKAPKGQQVPRKTSPPITVANYNAFETQPLFKSTVFDTIIVINADPSFVARLKQHYSQLNTAVMIAIRSDDYVRETRVHQPTIVEMPVSTQLPSSYEMEELDDIDDIDDIDDHKPKVAGTETDDDEFAEEDGFDGLPMIVQEERESTLVHPSLEAIFGKYPLGMSLYQSLVINADVATIVDIVEYIDLSQVRPGEPFTSQVSRAISEINADLQREGLGKVEPIIDPMNTTVGYRYIQDPSDPADSGRRERDKTLLQTRLIQYAHEKLASSFDGVSVGNRALVRFFESDPDGSITYPKLWAYIHHMDDPKQETLYFMRHEHLALLLGKLLRDKVLTKFDIHDYLMHERDEAEIDPIGDEESSTSEGFKRYTIKLKIQRLNAFFSRNRIPLTIEAIQFGSLEKGGDGYALFDEAPDRSLLSRLLVQKTQEQLLQRLETLKENEWKKVGPYQVRFFQEQEETEMPVYALVSRKIQADDQYLAVYIFQNKNQYDFMKYVVEHHGYLEALRYEQAYTQGEQQHLYKRTSIASTELATVALMNGYSQPLFQGVTGDIRIGYTLFGDNYFRHDALNTAANTIQDQRRKTYTVTDPQKNIVQKLHIISVQQDIGVQLNSDVAGLLQLEAGNNQVTVELATESKKELERLLSSNEDNGNVPRKLTDPEEIKRQNLAGVFAKLLKAAGELGLSIEPGTTGRRSLQFPFFTSTSPQID